MTRHNLLLARRIPRWLALMPERHRTPGLLASYERLRRSSQIETISYERPYCVDRTRLQQRSP